MKNCPNYGRAQNSVFNPKKAQQKLLNQKRVHEEALKLLTEKTDMFQRYLKKPSVSSIGFLGLEQFEKNKLSPGRLSHEKQTMDTAYYAANDLQGSESLSLSTSVFPFG